MREFKQQRRVRSGSVLQVIPNPGVYFGTPSGDAGLGFLFPSWGGYSGVFADQSLNDDSWRSDPLGAVAAAKARFDEALGWLDHEWKNELDPVGVALGRWHELIRSAEARVRATVFDRKGATSFHQAGLFTDFLNRSALMAVGLINDARSGRGIASPDGQGGIVNFRGSNPAPPKPKGKGPRGPKQQPGPTTPKPSSGPPETIYTRDDSAATGSSSRGSDYRESGGPKPSKDSGTTSTGASSQETGKTADDKAKDKDKKTDKEKEEEKGGKKGKSDGGWGGDVGTVVVGGEGQIREAGWTAGVSGGKPVSASDDAPQQPADAQPPEDPPAEDDGSETGSGGGNNTTRGNPLDDDGGESDHESRRFTHHYMPPETRALFAFTELGRALAPKGPPLPGSGGPTDRGWTPFRARTAAAGPPESAAYGREALKNAFADGSLGGALAGRPYHGRPTDDGGQVPVAADARTSGDESDADAKASRDAVRQMIWNKFAAPRIRYARRMR